MNINVKIGIIANIANDKSLDISRELVNILKKQSICYHIFDSNIRDKDKLLEFSSKCNLILVIGGDGTILSVLRCASLYDIPIMGINTGRKGFLAEINDDKLEDAITQIISNDYFIEERLLLSAKIYNQNDEIISDDIIAVNDFNISRQGHARMIRLVVYVNSELTESFDADGILISSPIGSTGYSLSAGGPVVMPGVNCILLTPVCSHSLHTRPIIAADDVCVKICATDKLDDVILTVDGQHSRTIPIDGYVEVSKAMKKARFIRLGNENYYKKFREKMINWSIT